MFKKFTVIVRATLTVQTEKNYLAKIYFCNLGVVIIVHALTNLCNYLLLNIIVIL